MAHGPDTEELLRRVANIRNGELNLVQLNITTLPDLPSGLQKLYCSYAALTSLPELPSSLKVLWCTSMPLTSLPELPSGLEELYCRNTQLTTLPDLPSGLTKLDCSNTRLISIPELPRGLTLFNCYNTQIRILPELPPSLDFLSCNNNSSLILKRAINEHIPHYNLRWRAWREEEAAKKRAQERSRAIKEELVAAAWAPKRVEKWLEVGGFELLEAL